MLLLRQQHSRPVLLTLLSLLFCLITTNQARAVSITSVADGVAYIEVTVGSDINPAFDLLESYIPTDSEVSSGVVDLLNSTSFDSKIFAKNDVILNIRTGVVLTLESPELLQSAIDLTNTSNSGVSGGGTIDLGGNSQFGIYGNAPQSPSIGNPVGPTTEPLTIIGWRQGVAIYSTNSLAASNVQLVNLRISSPFVSNVQFPLIVSNRPGLNGIWVDGATLRNVTVDGADSNGNGGEFSAANQYTADQITLQGVHNAVIENAFSTNGGENGITVSWGSRNVLITDSTASFADAHGFNIGGGAYALDVADISGFVEGMIIQGQLSGALGRVWRIFPNRIWIQDAEGAQFRDGETISQANGNPSPATAITKQNRTADVSLVNALGEGNGIDAGGSVDANGQWIAFADFYIQQANNATINGTATSSGRQDTGGAFYGVFAASATYTLGDIVYENYGTNQIPVGAFGDASEIASQLGNSTINVISTGGSVIGTDNDDFFNASENDDNLQGRGGSDIISGDSGNDVLDGGADMDMISGGTGNDQILGGAGDDMLMGNEGTDQIAGGPGDDIIDGGIDGDVLNGDAGDDQINGGDGPDDISGGTGQDTLFGDADADLIDGNDGNDILNGGAGDDVITGGNGNDSIDGGDGADQIDANDGNDSIEGGAGNDMITAGNGDDTVRGGDGIDQINGNAGDDLLFGGEMGDTLNGDDGNDRIFAEDGDDSISGGIGSDTLNGGLGNDSLTGDAGNDTLIGGAGNDSLDGGADNDRLFGNNDDDLMNGQDGNDTLFGGAGVDIISGGNGSDRMNGNSGNDIVDGNDGIDFVFGGGDDDIVRGGEGNDFLYGQAGDDDVFGSIGDDLLNGGGGDDFLSGNEGMDRLFGSQGDDILFGGDQIDQLHGGTGNDSLNGNDGEDTLIGFSGDDFLNGGNGNDSLRGGNDDDTLSGNAGADTFIFDSGWGNDTITDFANGTEILDMRNVGGLNSLDDLTVTRGPGDSGVLIVFGADSILLENRVPSQIDPTDFRF